MKKLSLFLLLVTVICSVWTTPAMNANHENDRTVTSADLVNDVEFRAVIHRMIAKDETAKDQFIALYDSGLKAKYKGLEQLSDQDYSNVIKQSMIQISMNSGSTATATLLAKGRCNSRNNCEYICCLMESYYGINANGCKRRC